MDDITLKEVAPFASYHHSGMGDLTIQGNVGRGAMLRLSGMGDVLIKGNIEEEVVIDCSGMGDVRINGTMPQTFTFTKSGMGDLFFGKTLDEKQIKQLLISGLGKVFHGEYKTPITKPERKEGVRMSSVITGRSIIINGVDVTGILQDAGVLRPEDRSRRVVVTSGRITVNGEDVTDLIQPFLKE